MNQQVNGPDANALTPLDPELLSSEQYQEHQADAVEQNVFGGEENAVATTALVAQFVQSREQQAERPLEDWLDEEFSKHPHLWQSPAQRQASAKEVIESVTHGYAASRSLHEHLARGQSEASWVARELEKAAGVAGNVGVGRYATAIDVALAEATAGARVMITNNNGDISFSPNLDGYIAEQHHVDTFNIDAVTKGSEYRARVVNSNELNSVDIQIVDGQGNVVHEYQSKYGADAEATERLFKRGEYGEQKRLVPEGQAKDVPDSTETIEIDGVQSEPLSKEQAGEWQRKAREEAEARQYDWNDTNRINIAKNLGKQALIGAGIAASLQGVRILARRAWNRFKGRENPAASADLKAFFDSSLDSTLQVATQVAVSGALVVAAKNGLLGPVLKRTPAGRIANIACIAVANAKILHKLAKGQLSGGEAVELMGQTTVSTLCSLAAASKGGAMGASIGTVFGPPGIVVGGFVGGVLGGMAGGVIGERAFNAGKHLVKTAVAVVNSVSASLAEGARNLAKGLGNLAKGLFA
ncbi:hypothetical protein [Pseudomonas sp. Irchel 3E20]|uniref:hypothetical protein n=1 Tax=Pseudomonas sp. Irchel 3E20 TaxID=2008983 RepID=UPI000BA3B3B4|nr:hypothetical protein [Pseudomonas sp. Irchel 3E20]